MKRKVFDGYLLRVKMAEADLGTNDVAEKLRVSATVVSEWRGGKEPKDMEQVADLARAIGCSANELYSEVKA